jgi:hypothetical protein
MSMACVKDIGEGSVLMSFDWLIVVMLPHDPVRSDLAAESNAQLEQVYPPFSATLLVLDASCLFPVQT